ncbi:MAG: hypothetical protein ACK2U1_00460 [Anaerolineales bacterium]|jgi:ABC-type glycerol-3-phosphate transport system substrate-binding protein
MEIITSKRMSQNSKPLVLIILLLLLLAGCQSDQDTGALRSSVTLWHSWAPSEAAVLDKAITQFEELHPEVDVIVVSLPDDEVLDVFLDALVAMASGWRC